tara:strand:- start:28 stop:612 length:585 start_codon:yes stop_codon:yes gene_type:complete
MNIKKLIKPLNIHIFYVSLVVLLSGCGPALIVVGAGAASYYSYSKDQILNNNRDMQEKDTQILKNYEENQNKSKKSKLKKIKPLSSQKKITANKNTSKQEKIIKSKKSISIIGQSDYQLIESIGVPVLKKVEKNSAMWVYKNKICILHIFFYKKNKNYKKLTSTYFDYTLLHNIKTNSDHCVNSFFLDKEISIK